MQIYVHVSVGVGVSFKFMPRTFWGLSAFSCFTLQVKLCTYLTQSLHCHTCVFNTNRNLTLQKQLNCLKNKWIVSVHNHYHDHSHDHMVSRLICTPCSPCGTNGIMFASCEQTFWVHRWNILMKNAWIKVDLKL